MEKIGLLAGIGSLPAEFALAAHSLQQEVCCVALLDDTDARLPKLCAKFTSINIARLGEIIDYLHEQQIKKVTMLGKVTKELLFSGAHAQPDGRMMQFLATLPNQKDDTIMLGFVAELAKEGIETLDQSKLLRLLMPQAGVLTKIEPTAADYADIEFGFQVAKALGGIDVGQTVVVKQKAVMALEAIEGTDACIRRGGALARGGAVVVKTAKPRQDQRFDLPTVGKDTLAAMEEVGAKVLAIEAGKTFIADRQAVLAQAKEKGIVIVAV